MMKPSKVVYIFVLAFLTIFIMLGVMALLLRNDSKINKVEIKTYEECVNAGYPVMETYPPSCRANGETFYKKIDYVTPTSMRKCQRQGEMCGGFGGFTCCNGYDCAGKGDYPDASGICEKSGNGGSCKNMCGDGICQEIVCQSTNCPCAESITSCPSDCK